MATSEIIGKGMKAVLPLADDAAVFALRRNTQPVPLAPDADAGTDVLGACAPVIETVGSVSDKVGLGLMMGVPLIGGLGWLLTKIPGGGAVGGLLQKPKHFFDKDSKLPITSAKHIAETNAKLPADQHIKPTLGNDLFHLSMVVGSGVQTYQVAHSYFQKRKILKLIRCDMAADRKARHLSNSAGDAAPLTEADKHTLLEHGLRGLLTVGSLALLTRGMLRGNISNLAFFAPSIAQMGIDMFMSENALVNAYTPFREAYKHGHASQQDYAGFLFAVSKDLNSRGDLAQPVAMKLAEHYVAGKASPGHILNDMADGTFKKLLKDAVAAVDAEHPPAAVHADKNHVKALNGAKTVGPVLGKHTGELHHKAQAQHTVRDIHGLTT